jgi:hypothetical protein
MSLNALKESFMSPSALKESFNAAATPPSEKASQP